MITDRKFVHPLKKKNKHQQQLIRFKLSLLPVADYGDAIGDRFV